MARGQHLGDGSAQPAQDGVVLDRDDPAGAATAMGFVPMSRVRPRVGATSGDVLLMVMPMKPRADARIAYQPAMPK